MQTVVIKDPKQLEIKRIKLADMLKKNIQRRKGNKKSTIINS